MTSCRVPVATLSVLSPTVHNSTGQKPGRAKSTYQLYPIACMRRSVLIILSGTNYAATLIDTCNPNRCARSTRVSNRNSSIFPFNNALTRGCVICSTSAVSCCFSPRDLMVSEIVIINAERSFRFSCRTGSSSSASHTLSNCVFSLMIVVSPISLSMRVSLLPNPACSFSGISFERHATRKSCLQT